MSSTIRTLLVSLGAALAVASTGGACARKTPVQVTYFDQTVSPILQTTCARSPTGAGCHTADAKGNAFGNLDVSHFTGVDKRRDLLTTYGPYGAPAMLAKNVPPFQVTVTAYDGKSVTVTSDIRHAGGAPLDPTSNAYMTLARWMDNGATENNAPPSNAIDASGSCDTGIPGGAGFDASKDPTGKDWSVFLDKAAPILKQQCASTHCHGSTGNQLHLTCGDTPEQRRWNYFASLSYIGTTVESSELLRRPLDGSQGGAFHEGGVVWKTAGESGYQGVLAWIAAHGPADPGSITPTLDFFAHRVQPVLVRKGCMLVHCHSGASFHDYRLRGGSAGSFSLASTKQNYALSVAQLSLESDDPNASRLVRKNLYRPEQMQGGTGIAHRGGALFEDFGGVPATAQSCASGNYDYDNGDLDKIPAYCVIDEWLRRERASRKLTPLSAVVYVKRSIPKADRYQDWDVYSPGADLRVAQVTDGPTGVTVTGDASMSGPCGLDPQTADVRRPMVSWDGKKVAFAARSSASEPLRIYEMAVDGSSCLQHPDINAGPPTKNGQLVHNFDPAYSMPDADGSYSIIFASTRGNLDASLYDYDGPQRTPADPSKLNANIYAWEPDPKDHNVHRTTQWTFLLDMERGPAFMADGRAIFTTEKRAPGFYQLALRRINIDGGDYHPLFGQRGSVGVDEVTQVAHLSDKNFVAIFAQHGAAHHGGAIGTINRSIGVDFYSANKDDYPVDPSAIDPMAPNSPEPEFFLHSLRMLDPTASGKPGTPTTGLYASPSPIPNDRVLVSWGAATDAATFNGDYDVWVMNAVTGQKTKLLGDQGTAEVDAVGVFTRPVRKIYRSNPGEPNAYTIDESKAYADLTFHDAPLVLSLAFQNTPTGRPVEPLTSFEVYESLPPPADKTSFAELDPQFVAQDAWGKVWVKRRKLGTVPIANDGSAHFRVPGGTPLVVHLPDTKEGAGRPRWQREEMMFGPGEFVHEAFRKDLYDAMCAMCHGARSGRPLDAAMRPDLLVGASQTVARDQAATDLFVPPGARGAIVGPPSTP